MDEDLELALSSVLLFIFSLMKAIKGLNNFPNQHTLLKVFYTRTDFRY